MTKCLFCSFCEQSVQSFRLIGYCFLLLLGVMTRKCLQMLSCTNPIQASSGPHYLREDKKNPTHRFASSMSGFFFNMMRCQWTCSKQLLRKTNAALNIQQYCVDRTSLTGETFSATPQQSKVFLNNFLVHLCGFLFFLLSSSFMAFTVPDKG